MTGTLGTELLVVSDETKAPVGRDFLKKSIWELECGQRRCEQLKCLKSKKEHAGIKTKNGLIISKTFPKMSDRSTGGPVFKPLWVRFFLPMNHL